MSEGDGMDFSEAYNEVVDRAVEGVRRDWMASLEMLARLCELYGPTLAPHDEALASSMEFVALRTRRVLERIAVEGKGDE